MEDIQIKYDVLGEEAPQIPENIPDILRLATKNVPAHMKPAVMNSVFPALGALMHNVRFRYIDNVTHEPHFMCGMVGRMSIGKGSINPVIEAIIHSIQEHDAISKAKLDEWRNQCRSIGANKQKPARPEDAAILNPEPDMTNPALIQLLMDAEKDGNRFLYTNIPEVDLLDQCSGGHKKVTRLIRLAYDISRLGAQRATVDGISGSPRLRWNFNFSCVEDKAISFFKACLSDGTQSRIGFSYVQKHRDRTGIVPKQGIYTEEFQKQLDGYLVRLQAATGEISCPRANTLANELSKEMATISSLSDDDNFEDMTYRAVAIAWLKGCVLYVANGNKWSNAISDFVRWSLYYDLWSKLALFAEELNISNKSVDTSQTRKKGPANMLEMLSDVFTAKDLEDKRVKRGKSISGTANLLSQWKSRGYITQNADGTFTKTSTFSSIGSV